MPNVTLYVRCLTCWAGHFVTTVVDRHLPVGIKATCLTCNDERMMATTAQVVSTLSPAQMRSLHRAQQTRTRPEWEQLPLVEALRPAERPVPAPGDVRSFHRAPKG